MSTHIMRNDATGTLCGLGTFFRDDVGSLCPPCWDTHRRALLELAETAWILIANAGQGDWSREASDWRTSAEKWRDRYHAAICDDPGAALVAEVDPLRARVREREDKA